MSDPGLAALTATELLTGYREGRFTPVEVLRDVEALIDAGEPELGAFYVREPEVARAQAEASTRRWAEGTPEGLIDGVPITLKENIATAGTPTPSGTAALADNPPHTEDGPVATHVNRAGGVRLGKTTMPDYGMLSAGVSSLHGITRNPWNPAWTSGGSSSGSATAAAAGFGPLHAGSDIGGSVRLPAGWTALASLKPTWSIIPVDPPYLGRVIGPLARSVDDVALSMAVFAQPDALGRDYTHTTNEQDWASVWERPLQDEDLRGMRIGVHVDAGGGLPTEPAIAAAVEAAAAVFAQAGATVERIEPFCSQELLTLVDRFLRLRSWADIKALPRDRRAKVLPYIREWTLGAADMSGVEAMEAYHGTVRLRAATHAATHGFDAVLSPVAPNGAAPAEWHAPTNDPDTALEHIAYTLPYNLSEQPAATVNAGFDEAGRPIGLQIAGHRFQDVQVLRLARWYEQARPASAVPAWPWGGRRE